MAAAATSCRLPSVLARRSAPCLVRQNTSTRSSSPSISSTSASCLVAGVHATKDCRRRWPSDSSSGSWPTSSRAASVLNSSASRPTAPSSVAEKNMVCRSVGRRADDGLDLWLEAHVEHPVGLVHDQDLDAGQAQHASLAEVGEAAGRGDQQVGRCGPLGLSVEADAPVADGHAQVARGGQGGEVVGDLGGQLPGGGQHERRRSAAIAGEALDDGQAEGQGLAGARRGAHEHVAPGGRHGQHELLDGEGGGDAGGRKHRGHAVAHAELGEGGGVQMHLLLADDAAAWSGDRHFDRPPR